jgi:hypothetical protein
MTSVDYERIGRAHEMLVAYRCIRSGVVSGRISEHDRDGSEILNELTSLEYDALERLLASQGWAIEVVDDTDAGIPMGHKAWLALRRGDAHKSSIMTMEPVWRSTALSSTEKRSTTIFWFTFMWLILLGIIYERKSRAVSEVSDYLSAVFDRVEIEQRINEQLEAVRRRDSNVDPTRLPIAAALLAGDAKTSTSNSNVDRRVRKFLNALTDAKFVEEYSEIADRYRQTLLFAKQMEVLFSAGLASLVGADQRIEMAMDEILAGPRSEADADPESEDVTEHATQDTANDGEA